MADLLEHLEAIYGGRYEMQRVDIQDAKRLTLAHLDQVVSIDLFKSGRTNIGGTNCPLKDEIKKHVDEFRKDPKYFDKALQAVGAAPVSPQEAITKIITKELFDFLPNHDRQALIASYQIILADIALVDYSPSVMPVGRVYEGFLGELVVRTGMCTRILLQDPTYNLLNAFETQSIQPIRPAQEP
jgi:hypothetical protein